MSRQFQFKLVLLGALQTGSRDLDSDPLDRRICGRKVQVRVCWAGVVPPKADVGACSLVLRFVKDQFDDYRESTIGGKNLFHQYINQVLTALCFSRIPHADRPAR